MYYIAQMFYGTARVISPYIISISLEISIKILTANKFIYLMFVSFIRKYYITHTVSFIQMILGNLLLLIEQKILSYMISSDISKISIYVLQNKLTAVNVACVKAIIPCCILSTTKLIFQTH